ncbi:PTS system sucrose-specific EIIBC component-like [Nilaparvata lugens]|uniref:PTS system sucrose-specific EIIBC component-like n=1 Tax=Nilaparvata lugens TaxID=108931 RepID=UPI00193E55AD|nr:PTS system sucrose-specific EIIBC component-like [Nilaparvata lugens]
MDITATANALLPLLGGKENIASAAHCATRLRLVLVDDSKVDKEAIGKLDGVKAASARRSDPVIFGTGWSTRCMRNSSRRRASANPAGRSRRYRGEKAQPAAAHRPPAVEHLRADHPAIVASGLLMGLLGMVKTYGWADANSALFIMLDMFSSAAFIILPILIGFTAAREFGGNPYLGATLGGILTHPALTNAWGVAGGSTP